MFRLSIPLLLTAACGLAQAQSQVPPPATGADNPPATAGNEATPGITATCRTPSVHCPIVEPSQSSGSSVISTDSLPIGSATQVERGAGGPTESQYPTTQGSGSMGSGVTGAPTGPDTGPTIGIGR